MNDGVNQSDILLICELLQAGKWTDAELAYRALLQQHPTAAIYNNLGALYFKQSRWQDAFQCYQDAITLEPQYIDAYYNLGLTLVKQNKWEESVSVYRRLLELDSTHFAGRFHLACALMQLNEIDASLDEFSKIEKSNPHHFETHANMATCFLRNGNLDQARLHYLKASELMPQDTQILYNLGVINQQQGDVDHAIQYYQKAVKIDPDLFDAHNNLGVALMARRSPDLALTHFEEALRLQPSNKAIQYVITMLSRDRHLLTAPPDYIRSLFDAYADHYESHLLQALDYKIPSLLLDACFQVMQPSDSTLDIVDLGCGTGLCGVAFKPYARSMTGVDLSEKMLQVASEKNCYDVLVSSDVLTYLAGKANTVDVILAGDVLVYMGELDVLFGLVRKTLRESGLFIFNTEISHDKEYRMNQSGRFSHHEKYIDHLAKKQHLRVVYHDIIETRQQNNQPVYGYLYVLQAC